MDNLIQKIKEKPAIYFGLFLSIGFIIFYVISQIGTKPVKNINNNQKVEKSVLKPKITTEKEIKKNKLLASTNPEARTSELEKKEKEYNTNGSTVLKDKYLNTSSEHQEEIIEIKKENEKIKNEKLKQKNKIEELEKKIKQQEIIISNANNKNNDRNNNINNDRNNNRNYNKNNVNMNPEINKDLIDTIITTNQNNYNNANTVYTFSNTATTNKTDTNTTNIVQNELRFNIVPGSSFYGLLKNTLYSQYTSTGAFIEIQNPVFKDCSFMGDVQYLQYKGLAINVNKVVCKDGYTQTVNGKAFRMSDMKPIFSNEINRHLFPKIVLGTVDSIINLTRTSEQGLTTTDNTGVIEKNTSLIDEILQDEYNRYKEDEEVAYSQSLIVIFY